MVRADQGSRGPDEPRGESPDIDVRPATQAVLALVVEVRPVDEDTHPLRHEPPPSRKQGPENGSLEIRAWGPTSRRGTQGVQHEENIGPVKWQLQPNGGFRASAAYLRPFRGFCRLVIRTLVL